MGERLAAGLKEGKSRRVGQDTGGVVKGHVLDCLGSCDNVYSWKRSQRLRLTDCGVRRSSAFLSVGGVSTVFAEVVAVKKRLRYAFAFRIKGCSVKGHAGDIFEDDCVV